MIQTNAIINVLPNVGSVTKIYFTVILDDNSFNNATIISSNLMYGNALLTANNLFIAQDNNPIAIGVTATYSGVEYFSILYTKAVYGQVLPDNYARLVQKMPLGVFTDINPNELIGQILKAAGIMFDDYYKEYFNVQNQVYSNIYSPQLEYEYNGTVGLLSNSTYPNQLFQLLGRLGTVALNVYDLELFISKYIYYRLGVISSVYINENINDNSDYWNLGVLGLTELGSTTILGPDTNSIQNLFWTIFNASAFTNEFKTELINLITGLSRADIGNPVIFTDTANPVTVGFTSVGPTYKTDPRTLYNKCLKYIGDSNFPLNIIGYYK